MPELLPYNPESLLSSLLWTHWLKKITSYDPMCKLRCAGALGTQGAAERLWVWKPDRPEVQSQLSHDKLCSITFLPGWDFLTYKMEPIVHYENKRCSSTARGISGCFLIRVTWYFQVDHEPEGRLFIYLSIYLSIYLNIYPPIHHIYLSIYQLYLSISLAIDITISIYR